MDAGQERRGSHRWGFLATGILVGLLASFPLAVWLGTPTDRVLARWTQPADISYGGYDPYTLYIVEGARKWHVLGWESRWYEIRITRAGDGPGGYGHSTLLDLHSYRSPTVEHHLAECQVTWTADGVTFTEPTGHRVFVPKSAFVGGR